MIKASEVVTILNQSYSVSNQALYSHDAEYLGYVGLQSLDIKRMDADSDTLSSLAATLLQYPTGDSSLESTYIAQTSIQAIFMYTHVVSPGYIVTISDLEGFSLVYTENGNLYHALYEKRERPLQRFPNTKSS